MSTKSNKQKVKTFIDEDKMSVQEVNFDSKDQNGWLNIIHDGNELNLTLENWNKLNELVQKTVKS